MKARLLGWLIAMLIRVVGLTLRFRVDDRAGIRENNPDGALIWVFWHNRVFTVPVVYRRFLRKRSGSVLTSPSGDGEILTRVMKSFGVGAVRGSSNKQPAAALREMVRRMRAGEDIAITPDGPRGPRHELQAGAIKLAQLSGAPVLPIRMRYGRAITLKTWDKFQIPLPFTRVEVVFEPLHTVPRTSAPEEFESERLRLENLLKGAP